MTEKIGPDQEPRWADSPLPTPTYGLGGRATVICSTAAIAAPPAACLAIVLDTATYPSWNRFIPRATVRSPASSSPASPAPATSAEDAGAVPASLRARLEGIDPGRLLLRGTEFRFEVHMDPDNSARPRIQNTDLVVSRLEEFGGGGGGGDGGRRRGLRVVWKTAGDARYLRAERVQEFVERRGGEEQGQGEPGTDYVCYETFYGPVAPLVRRFAGSAILNGFGLWMTGLKKAAEENEKKAKEEKEQGEAGTQ